MSRHIARLMVILALGILVAPLTAEAQPLSKVPRIGFLMPSLTPERARNLEAFRQGLRELGWIEGQNVAIELRYAEEGTDTERLPNLAADLVRLNVDVMVTMGGTTRVAQDATSTIPIVMATAIDPVGQYHGACRPWYGVEREMAGDPQAGCASALAHRPPPEPHQSQCGLFARDAGRGPGLRGGIADPGGTPS